MSAPYQFDLPNGELILDSAHSRFCLKLDKSLEVSDTVFSDFSTIDPVGAVHVKIPSESVFHISRPVVASAHKERLSHF